MWVFFAGRSVGWSVGLRDCWPVTRLSQLLGVHLDAGFVTSSRLPRQPGSPPLGLRATAGACPDTGVGPFPHGWAKSGGPEPGAGLPCGTIQPRLRGPAHRAPAASPPRPRQSCPKTGRVSPLRGCPGGEGESRGGDGTDDSARAAAVGRGR